MASRIVKNGPDIVPRIEQHISETKHQITMLEEAPPAKWHFRSKAKDP